MIEEIDAGSILDNSWVLCKGCMMSITGKEVPALAPYKAFESCPALHASCMIYLASAFCCQQLVASAA